MFVTTETPLKRLHQFLWNCLCIFNISENRRKILYYLYFTQSLNIYTLIVHYSHKRIFKRKAVLETISLIYVVSLNISKINVPSSISVRDIKCTTKQTGLIAERFILRWIYVKIKEAANTFLTQSCLPTDVRRRWPTKQSIKIREFVNVIRFNRKAKAATLQAIANISEHR